MTIDFAVTITPAILTITSAASFGKPQDFENFTALFELCTDYVFGNEQPSVFHEILCISELYCKIVNVMVTGLCNESSADIAFQRRSSNDTGVLSRMRALHSTHSNRYVLNIIAVFLQDKSYWHLFSINKNLIQCESCIGHKVFSETTMKSITVPMITVTPKQPPVFDKTLVKHSADWFDSSDTPDSIASIMAIHFQRLISTLSVLIINFYRPKKR